MKCYRFRLPLTSPLKLRRQTIQHRDGILLEQDGRWAEASPLPGFSHETLEDVIAALRGERDEPPSLRFAFDSLKWPHRECCVPVNMLLTNGRLEIDSGYSAVKLKVGRSDMRSDVALVSRVHDALGSHQALRLDANRAWNLDAAIEFARQLANCDIQYIEEPLQDPSQLEEFYARTGVPYALDESLAEQSSLDEYPSAAAFVFKPTFLGGREKIPHLAKWNKPIVFSAAFESGVGIARIAELAHEFSPEIPAGLDIYSCLAEDVLKNRLTLRSGMLHTTRDLVADLDKLEEVRL